MLATIFGISNDKHVRFFKLTGEFCRDEKIAADDRTLYSVISPENSGELGGRNVPPANGKVLIETWGIPPWELLSL